MGEVCVQGQRVLLLCCGWKRKEGGAVGERQGASVPYHSAGGPRTEQCLLRQAAVEQGLRGPLAMMISMPLRHVDLWASHSEVKPFSNSRTYFYYFPGGGIETCQIQDSCISCFHTTLLTSPRRA